MSRLSKGKAILLPIFRERGIYGQLHAGCAFRRPLRFSSSASNGGNDSVSDKEWEVRVGRGIYVLSSTLPDFFQSGLIINASHDAGYGEDEPIYSKNIQLSYTPPVRLPAPFPQTLQIEGLPLYQASAVLLRTSLTTLYTECTVDLQRMKIETPTPRDRKVKIDLLMEGRNRVTGAHAEWNVYATYAFSPLSGRIYRHEIESIHPAPHSAVYDSLKHTLLRMIGEHPTPAMGGGEGKMPISSSATDRVDGSK